MKFLLSIAFFSLLLFSCNKDKTPPSCTSIKMTGERTLFVGKWHWYSTTVGQWFDLEMSPILNTIDSLNPLIRFFVVLGVTQLNVSKY